MRDKQVVHFIDLEAWQAAHKLALEIYSLTRSFPRGEQYGLTSQCRRAAVSVAANIAEGFSRYHFKDKARFYYQARGSVSEIQNYIFLTSDLGIIDSTLRVRMIASIESTRRLINGLIRSIERQL